MKNKRGLFQTFWHECRQWPERADRAVFKVFLSATEIFSSLKESSSKQRNVPVVLVLIVLPISVSKVVQEGHLQHPCRCTSLPYEVSFPSSFIWIRSRSFHFLIWTPTSRLCSFWKSKVFSSLFLFITYSQSPLTFYLRCPLLKYFLSFSFPWGEMKSVLSQWEAALLFYVWMWRFLNACTPYALGVWGVRNDLIWVAVRNPQWTERKLHTRMFTWFEAADATKK